MKKIVDTLKWISRAWPILPLILFAIYLPIFHHISDVLQPVNKVVGFLFQILGGIIVVVYINQDIGNFKYGNIFSMMGNYFKAFPLIKQHYEIKAESAMMTMTMGTPSLTVKRKADTLDEKLAELERQIDDCRQLVFDREEVILKEVHTIQLKIERSISKTNEEVQNVRKLLDDSIIGNIKPQIFGVLLSICGATLTLL